MQKTLQQIPLNFGEEPEAPSPSAKEGNGTGDQHDKQYMAAAGVVVRVKSYKNQRPPATANVELFSAPPAETVQPEAVPAPVDKVEVLPRKEQRRTPTGKAAVPKAVPGKRGRKSLKQIAAEADLIEIPADEVLFSKQYYTMGEVSEMFRVNQSLLRFWETEFDILQPKKNKKGDRYFRPVDIKNLHLIYHLLRQKKYTIEGAKEFLRKNKKADERFEVIQRLQQIKSFLLEWKAAVAD
jgi:DNA-binding transcriptional MerR regulator